jgi:hypothetical protein
MLGVEVVVVVVLGRSYQGGDAGGCEARLSSWTLTGWGNMLGTNPTGLSCWRLGVRHVNVMTVLPKSHESD